MIVWEVKSNSLRILTRQFFNFLRVQYDIWWNTMFDFCKKRRRKLLLCKVGSRPSSPKATSLYRSTLTRTVKSRDFREDALIIMETLKQHRQRRLRKCLLKSEVALLQTLQHLFHLVQFVKCWQFFLDLNSKRPPEWRKPVNPCLTWF